jgi:hypothetical protein
LIEIYAELKPWREGDQSVMAAAYQYFNSAAALRAINRVHVRMLHRVFNVSDITAADGRALDQVLLVNKNDHVWPSQHHVLSLDYTSKVRTGAS